MFVNISTCVCAILCMCMYVSVCVLGGGVGWVGTGACMRACLLYEYVVNIPSFSLHFHPVAFGSMKAEITLFVSNILFPVKHIMIYLEFLKNFDVI